LGVAGAATFSSNLSVTQTFTAGQYQIYPQTTNGYTIMGLKGGNTTGYLYGDFQLFGDGIHLGYNYYASNGTAYSPNGFGNGGSRISMGYGTISLNVGSTSNLSTMVYIASNQISLLPGTGNVNMMSVTAIGVGVNTNVPSYTLDVNGVIQGAVYYSTITVGGIATVTPNNFGIFYNITTSGTYTLAFSASQASSNIGKYVVFRNNSGVTLSLALTGVSGITSPVTLSNAQSATIMVATTTTYALF